MSQKEISPETRRVVFGGFMGSVPSSSPPSADMQAPRSATRMALLPWRTSVGLRGRCLRNPKHIAAVGVCNWGLNA